MKEQSIEYLIFSDDMEEETEQLVDRISHCGFYLHKFELLCLYFHQGGYIDIQEIIRHLVGEF